MDLFPERCQSSRWCVSNHSVLLAKWIWAQSGVIDKRHSACIKCVAYIHRSVYLSNYWFGDVPDDSFEYSLRNMSCLSPIRPCEQINNGFVSRSDQAHVLQNVRGRQQPLRLGNVAVAAERQVWVNKQRKLPSCYCGTVKQVFLQS